MIEPLPSCWKGTVFRSRTEARWAVFFDAIGLRWEYEPEGFRLDDGTWYLPDFWLPEAQVWLEVKPDHGPNEDECRKVERLVAGTGFPCVVLNGAPWPKEYETCFHDGVGIEWLPVCFNEKHTAGRHDIRPRLYFVPAPHELEDPVIATAMNTARAMDLTEPDAGAHLPLGWEGIEPVC